MATCTGGTPTLLPLTQHLSRTGNKVPAVSNVDAPPLCLSLPSQFGAVAFLYHPCAPADQVLTLKDLARQCLWKHLVTPYLDLDPTHVRPSSLIDPVCTLLSAPTFIC